MTPLMVREPNVLFSKSQQPWLISLRRTLFPNMGSGIVSLLLLTGLLWAGWSLVSWGILHAVFRADSQVCRAASGACWGIISEKARLIVMGRYPLEEQWRMVLGTLVLAAGVLCVSHPLFWNGRGLIAALSSLAIMLALMAGGVAGLPAVGTDLWGGLPLTLLLTALGCLLAVPLGILFALGRRSSLPVLHAMCVAYIETVRGVPLIAWLFFGAFVLPLFLPAHWQIDPMLRIGACLMFFSAVYLAEVFRGGLQAIPKEQYEAAHALSLTKFQTLRRVVLPQALRITIAPTVNIVISTLKNTALVSIVNLYDLTGTLKLALSDPEWHIFFAEAYIFVSTIYLVLGIGIARYGRFLESRNVVDHRSKP